MASLASSFFKTPNDYRYYSRGEVGGHQQTKRRDYQGVWMGGGAFWGGGDLLVSKYATGHYIQLHHHHHVLCCIIQSVTFISYYGFGFAFVGGFFRVVVYISNILCISLPLNIKDNLIHFIKASSKEQRQRFTFQTNVQKDIIFSAFHIREQFVQCSGFFSLHNYLCFFFILVFSILFFLVQCVLLFYFIRDSIGLVVGNIYLFCLLFASWCMVC